MKWILIGVIIVGMAYIGYGISRYYHKRKRYFDDMILLCEKLCVDISFSKENLHSIISSSLDNYSKDFKKGAESYLEYLKNNSNEINEEMLFKKDSLLKEEEKQIVLLFFRSLGRLDASNQISEINNFKSKFVAYKENAEEDNKKFGSLSFKLMLLFGVMIVIILL